VGGGLHVLEQIDFLNDTAFSLFHREEPLEEALISHSYVQFFEVFKSHDSRLRNGGDLVIKK